MHLSGFQQICASIIVAIVGTVILRSIIYSPARRYKRRCHLYKRIRWIKLSEFPLAKAPGSEEVISPNKYDPGPEPKFRDLALREMIEKGPKWPLVIGETLRGKTRAVYEALKALAKGPLKGFWVVRPSTEAPADEIATLKGFFLTKPKIVLFLDNLNKYLRQEESRIHEIIERFEEKSSRLIVIATIRSDRPPNELERLRKDLAWKDFKEINLNRGLPEVLARREEIIDQMNTQYAGAGASERSIMWAVKFLNLVNVEARRGRVEGVYVKFFEGQEKEFASGFGNLTKIGLLSEQKRNILFAHDSHLQDVITDFPYDDIELSAKLGDLAQFFAEQKDYGAILNIGISLGLSGMDAEALECFNKAIEIKSDLFEAWFNKGFALGHLSRGDEAIQAYSKTIELNPNFAAAYNNRGEAYRREGDLELAITDFNEAIELNPDLPEPYNNRGSVYADRNEYDLAIADYNEAVKLNPHYANAYYNRGNTYLSKNEYDKAIADYTKAVEINPSFAMAYNNRGATFGLKGNPDSAILDLNKALQLNPNLAATYNNRGGAYRDKGESDLAIADFDKAIELNPDFAAAYNNRGATYGNKGVYAAALDDFIKALRLETDNFDAWLNKGRALLSLERPEEALEAFSEAIRLRPDDSQPRCYKAKAAAKLRRKEEMLQALKEAIGIAPRVKELAKEEQDFKEYWEDEDFNAVVS